MMAGRHSTSLVVSACAVVLVVSCVLWALLVQRIGTDVCSLHPVPKRAGPVSCPHRLRSVAAERANGGRVHGGG